MGERWNSGDPDGPRTPDRTHRTGEAEAPLSPDERGPAGDAGSPRPTGGQAYAGDADRLRAHGRQRHGAGTDGRRAGDEDPHRHTGGEETHGNGVPGLLAREERDKLTQRLQHAVTTFVDAPQESVREADRVIEEATSRLTALLAERHRNLRSSWSEGPGTKAAEGTATAPDGPHGVAEGGAAADTERLRLALRDYREFAERLLRT
ncbi:hypothetical protein [Streptomyces indicus]|uniref:Uncharacterized protein n=1 Tax=Streptomyces indicus TaxID=417292 RepID=A0A1G8YEI6_9ACTN|nr:hypothetical protein [Streptomyces indicus]SDK01248.1 hypothetical protein SAMN05421806_10422 [Streptomyces indicus]